MPNSKPAALRFVLKSTDDPSAVMARFFPQGQTILNRTEWRGKDPRTCGLTSLRVRPYSAGSDEPKAFDLEVTYRPKGYITFVGATRYDGWTMMVLDRQKDGIPLDGHGQPLLEGQAPVYLPFDVYPDVDFNELDFGDFVGEFAVEQIRRLMFEDVQKQIQESPAFSASIRSTFIAPRRHRPLVKIVLSNAPTGTRTDGFGTRIVHLNNYTPHLQQVLLDELTELVSGFIEGRYSIKNLSNDEVVFVELSDVVVDCTPNEEQQESRFNCLNEYVPDSLFEELAKRMIATYEVDVSVVLGPEAGLLLKPSK